MRKLLTVAMLGLVGCVGDLGPVNEPSDTDPPIPPPSGEKTARAAFDADVYGTIDAKCGGCHENNATKGGAPVTSGFVGRPASGAYDIIVTFPNVHGNFASTAKILTYVTQQGHQGISYSTDEATKIQNWLALELAERANDPGTGTGPEGPGQATARLLGEFSACMTQTDFDAANMPEACGRMQATNNQECDNCHNNGGDGHVASRLSNQFFTIMSQHSTYLQKYFMVAGAENPSTAKIDRNVPMFEAVLGRTGMYFEHPAVDNPANNECTQAMQQFLGLVQAKITAGAAACGPSKLVD
jgi:cytochrome c553